MRGGALSYLVVAAAVLVLPASSSASSTVLVAARHALFYEAFSNGGEVNDVTVSADADSLTFKDGAGIFAGGGCQQLGPDSARCTGMGAGLEMDLGGKDDRVVLDRSVNAFFAKASLYTDVVLLGGSGDDHLQAPPLPADIYHRHRVLLRGGPGADDLSGSGVQVDYSDVISGGVSVSLDGIANDGNSDDESGGRRDNVGAGTFITGTDFADVLTGDGASNELDGRGGDDRITGGKGRDVVTGGDGNDAVDVRDGAADAVRCGSGVDAVRSDQRSLDSIAAKDCESVDALPGACEAMDRFNARHSHPKRFGAPSSPKAGGLYLGKTSFGLPVRVNISRSRRAFAPTSRFSYKWCFHNRVQPVDLKVTGDVIARDGSFDIVHKSANGYGVRHLRGRFYDHGRKVSGVITDKFGSRDHGGPVTFVATLTPRK